MQLFLFIKKNRLETTVSMKMPEKYIENLMTSVNTSFDSSRQLKHDIIRLRFRRRFQLLITVCEKLKDSTKFRPLNKNLDRTIGPFWPLMNASVNYCGIEKIGSTTMDGILNKLSNKAKVILQSKQRNNKTVEPKLIASKNVSFFFVREPYGRLLSAYMDKLFVPNTVYWKVVGRYIVSNFRTNASSQSLRCGHDVTFPEFIRYVIHSQETGKFRDGHFVPIHDHCRMCKRHFDYIGHLETFSEDVAYILDAVHSPYNYSKDYSSNTLRFLSIRTLKMMRAEVMQCMTLYEGAKRLWINFLQRGLISKSEVFSLDNLTATNISADNFSRISIRARERSKFDIGIRKQTNEALIAAFATVPLNDKLHLKEVLSLDFDLFGFEPKPYFVFGDHNTIAKKKFSFTYLWQPK